MFQKFDFDMIALKAFTDVCKSFEGLIMTEDNKPDKISPLHQLWRRLWGHKSKAEKKRLTSFIPLVRYTFAFVYGVIYLSILNTVNRDRTGTTVKRGFVNLSSKELIERERNLREIEASFKNLRKRVAGGR